MVKPISAASGAPSSSSSSSSSSSLSTDAGSVDTPPNLSWSADGQWVVWSDKGDSSVVIARTTDFKPVRKLDHRAIGASFAGNMVIYNEVDSEDAHFETPDGSRKHVLKKTFVSYGDENHIATRDFVTLPAGTGGPRIVALKDGSERTVAVSKLCPPKTDLNGLTPASVAGDANLITFDVECHLQGAKPCTGARGNCESRDDGAIVLDAARGAVTKLGSGYWAHADIVRFSPDGSKLFVMPQTGRALNLIDSKTGTHLKTINLVPKDSGMGIWCGAWAPDGIEVAAIVGHSLAMASTRTFVARKPIEHPKLENAMGCGLHFAGTDFLLVQAGLDSLVRFRMPKLDAPVEFDGDMRSKPGEDALSTNTAIAPDGRTAIVSNGRRSKVLDIISWTSTDVPAGGSGDVSIDPTSRFVAIGRGIWQLRPLKRMATLN